MRVHEIRALHAECLYAWFRQSTFHELIHVFSYGCGEKHSCQLFHAGMQKVGEKNCHFKACF